MSTNFFGFIMKKLLILFIYCFIISVSPFPRGLSLCGEIFAWEDCPSGEKDCQYPGKCGLYTDTDKDGICDFSQPAPDNRAEIKKDDLEEENIQELFEEHNLISGKDIRTKTVNEIAEIYEIDSKEFTKKLGEYLGIKIPTSYSFQLLHDNYGLSSRVVKEIASSLKKTRDVDMGTLETEKELLVRKYHFIPIIIVLILFYLTTFTLFKLKVFTRITHLIIWNCILLISFIVSSLLGILLIIRVNFGLPISLPFNILFWHVESGIVMMVIGIFHLTYNWRFYKHIFMKK